jgi:Tetratricopeptide repeat
MISAVFVAILLFNSPTTHEKKGEAQVQFTLGQLSYKQKKYEKSLKHFNSALKLNPALANIKQWRGLTLFALKKYKEALPDLEFASTKNRSNANLYKILGVTQLHLKKYMWALRNLKGSLELNDKDNEVRLYLGYCLLRVDEFDDAKELFNEIIKNEKDIKLVKKAKFFLSLCYLKDKKYKNARLTLSGISSGEWGKTSSSLLQMLSIKELGLIKGYGTFVSFNSGFDSNPSVNNENYGAINEKDKGITVSFTTKMWWNPTYHLNSDFSVKRSSYHSFDSEVNERIKSFNFTSINGGGSYLFNYLSSGLHKGFRIGYRFNLNLLDGGEGIPLEPDLFVFSEKHNLTFSWYSIKSKNRSVTLDFKTYYSAYRDEAREGPGYLLTASWHLFFKKQKYKFFPQIFTGYHHAKWDPWKIVNLGVWLGGSMVGFFNLDYTGWISHEIKFHLNSAPEFQDEPDNSWGIQPGAYREDYETSIAFSVGKSIDKKKRLRVDLSLSYLNNWSTASFFKYERFIALLGISYNYDFSKRGK